LKIPKQFDLGGATWKVVESEHFPDMGHCDIEKMEIVLRSGLSDQAKQVTFCHELVHAILFSTGKTEHDDRETFGSGLKT
jgi:Zn-dependent peptidase ImmA (M78 family)